MFQPASPRPSKLRPYRQGELDALCGPYSIINAFPWCLGDHPLAAKGPHWAAPFALLHDYAVKELGYLGLGASGLSLNGMIWLLRTAQNHMGDEHGISFQTHRPFALGRPRQVEDIATTIAEHLLRPHSAVIAAVYGTLNHWCVLTNLTSEHAHLFDSSGINRLPINILHPAALLQPNLRRSHVKPGSVAHISYVTK